MQTTKLTGAAPMRTSSTRCGMDWEHGQHIGSETVHVLAWLGPHKASGGDSGYRFSWSDLRDPVIDAVTGAGWTYKPKKV